MKKIVTRKGKPKDTQEFPGNTLIVKLKRGWIGNNDVILGTRRGDATTRDGNPVDFKTKFNPPTSPPETYVKQLHDNFRHHPSNEESSIRTGRKCDNVAEDGD